MPAREYCAECAVPAIRHYLAKLQTEQGLNTAQLRQTPDKDSAQAMLLRQIINARAKLIAIKQDELEIASAGCCLDYSHPHTE